MNMFQAFMVVLVLVASYVAIKYILGHQAKPPTGSCVSAMANIVLPAGGSATSVPCCEDENGACLTGYSTSYGPVTLVPTVATAACPPYTLTPAQYAPYLSNPAGNVPATANVVGMAALYPTKGCGDIQAALTRYCANAGDTPASCVGGIAVARGGGLTVSCPGGRTVLPTRQLVIPSDFSKATCQGSDACCFTDLGSLPGPASSITLNPAVDTAPTPCAGQPLDEILFYTCEDA